MKIQIIFHSMSGHVYKLAESIAAGAREVYETWVTLYQVPELIPQETLVATGAQASRSGSPIFRWQHLSRWSRLMPSYSEHLPASV